MDWETLYCPNRSCRLYGVRWPKSALVKNGSSRGYKQTLCRSCGQTVFVRYGTAYFELEAEQAIFDTAIRALAEGNSLRATARIVQIDKDTACAWLDRAARLSSGGVVLVAAVARQRVPAGRVVEFRPHQRAEPPCSQAVLRDVW